MTNDSSPTPTSTPPVRRCIEQGEHAEGVRQLSQALTNLREQGHPLIWTEEADQLAYLGLGRLCLGEVDAARRHLQEAQALNPELATVRRLRRELPPVA